MGKALTEQPQTETRTANATPAAGRAVNWRSKVSDHVAYSLLVYTGLHIFVTMTALKSGGGSLLPYFALVVLVVAIIPALRMLEMRWQRFAASGASDAELRPLFRREMALLWLTAIGLPLVLTFAAKAVTAVL